MNPELRVILIRNGSLLDEDNLSLITSMAKESDYQVWIERVGKDKHHQIIIEDGMVESENEKAWTKVAETVESDEW